MKVPSSLLLDNHKASLYTLSIMSDIFEKLAVKKQELDKLKPLPEELVKNMEDWFRVELTYSSNAIEGNALSRIETAEVIERGTAAVISGRSLKDQLEAINHAKAIEFIKQLAVKRKTHQYITEQDIKDIHRIISTGIDDNWAGKYRQLEVFIRGSNAVFPKPHEVPYSMKVFIKWLQNIQDENPVKLSADAHFKFVSIHPFIDGNGRTGRLLMNLILVIYGYPMAVIRNEDRTEYLATFDTARDKKDLQPFYTIVIDAVERSLDAYISAVIGENIMTHLNPLKRAASGKLLKIGELAKITGETSHTLRFWTHFRLLKVKKRTKGGYQLYEPAMIARVKEIRRLQQEERLTIDEIRKRLT